MGASKLLFALMSKRKQIRHFKALEKFLSGKTIVTASSDTAWAVQTHVWHKRRATVLWCSVEMWPGKYWPMISHYCHVWANAATSLTVWMSISS